MKLGLHDSLKGFLGLFLPPICAACEKLLVIGEQELCIVCLAKLPTTNIANLKSNQVEMLLRGRVKIELATAFLEYRKENIVQQLVHKFKYKGLKQLGPFLMSYLGSSLKDSDFQQIDMVLPVPLHRKKLLERGYNQSEMLAIALAKILNRPMEAGAVKRVHYNKTQTRKGRLDRLENVQGIFRVLKPQRIKGKHILIVDDVVTTGSTIESLATELLANGAGTISFVALAYAVI
ncbi:MAG: ComF family protein [Bacteroidales bacterium]|nr:ComF family protein [Bacteroidales bacterium]